MRELNGHEIAMVGGGSGSTETMGTGCFSAMVFLGVSTFFGPVVVMGAVFNAFSACEGIDFTS